MCLAIESVLQNTGDKVAIYPSLQLPKLRSTSFHAVAYSLAHYPLYSTLAPQTPLPNMHLSQNRHRLLRRCRKITCVLHRVANHITV